MKEINLYITEKLKINKENSFKNPYNYFPKTREELISCIKELLHKRGLSANLNDIDVSNITDMHNVFNECTHEIANIDISNWDVSNVTNMEAMFKSCFKFNSDLSKWNVSNVTNMKEMFKSCYRFNSDLSKWNVSNVVNISGIFYNAWDFNHDISNWNVDNVKEHDDAFRNIINAKYKNFPEFK